MINVRKPLIITKHSKDRMNEYGISEEWVESLWQKSKRTKLPSNVILDKEKKYGSKIQSHFSYYRRCGYKLTIKFINDGEPVLVTITKCFSNNLRIK